MKHNMIAQLKMFRDNWNNKPSWTDGRGNKNLLAFIMKCLNKWIVDDLISRSCPLLEKWAEPEGTEFNAKKHIQCTRTLCANLKNVILMNCMLLSQNTMILRYFMSIFFDNLSTSFF